MEAYALFRVDANKEIGSGHVIRILILAHELQKKGLEICILYRNIPDDFIKDNPGFSFIQLQALEGEKDALVNFIYQLPNHIKKITIIDSDLPEFYEKDFQLSVRAAGSLLMIITFYDHHHFFADILLNQNIRAPLLNYSTEEYTRKLLGTSYVILKPDFQKVVSKDNNFEDKENNLLLFFGGADANDRTSRSLDLLNKIKLPLDKVIVVTGLLYNKLETLERIIIQSPYVIEHYQHTPFMAQLMAQSKYAMTSGGLTLWELAVTRTLCLTIPLSKREEITCNFLHDKKLIYNLGGDFLQKSAIDIRALTTIFMKKQNNQYMVNRFHLEVAIDGTKKIASQIIKLLEQ